MLLKIKTASIIDYILSSAIVGRELKTGMPGKMEKTGEYPYTLGIHSNMFDTRNGGRLWTMRQFAGCGTPLQTNKRFKYLEKKGATGRSVAFDMPTLLGFDSDNPLSDADIGMGGVAVDTIKDMAKIFSGIDLGPPSSTSMTINGPAIVLLAMYFELCRKRGYSLAEIRGTIQNDPLKEFIAQKEWIVPPAPSIKLLVDTIEYSLKHAPKWNPISISGYHIREAGASPAQEIAFTLADEIAYAEACLLRGLAVDDFAPRFSFFFDFYFDFDDDFVKEIAKLCVARKLRARIMRERFGAQNPNSWKLRTHIQTAGRTLTEEEPLNNIVRTALQAFGAALGGCQSLHTNSYDEQLSLPSEGAVKVALRTQQIIAYETGIAKYPDLLAGSRVFENLIEELETESRKIIETIDGMGGMMAAVERGWPQAQIEEYELGYRKKVEAGEIKIVGQNFLFDEPAPDPTFSVSEKTQDAQIKFLKEIKKKRSQNKVRRTLANLQRAVEENRNVMPEVCEAVKALTTIEEICSVFKNFYGIYSEEA